MDWKKVNSQNDIDKLMKEFYNFHDSCMTDFSCKTGMYVDKKKRMGQDGISEISIIFQSQLCNTIEIYFENIKSLNIYVWNKDKYFNNIDEVTVYIENDLIYWINSSMSNYNNLDNETTYIICEKVKYRYVNRNKK